MKLISVMMEQTSLMYLKKSFLDFYTENKASINKGKYIS